MWDIKNSKFYAEIMGGLARLLGLNSESATEAELHQALSEAGTIAEIKASAQSEAEQAVKVQMDVLTANIDALTKAQETFSAKLSEAQGQVDEINAQMGSIRSELEGKTKELADKTKEVETLSGEVAALRAGRDQDPKPGEAALPVAKRNAAGGVTIDASESKSNLF